MEQETIGEQAGQGGKKDHFLAVSILAAALIIGGSLIYGAGLKNPATAQPVTAQVVKGDVAPSAPVNVSIGDNVVLGDSKAPVTIIEFGDYQCPFCGKMFRDTEPKIREEYIKTGKAKMVYRDFPLSQIHPHAQPAAEAAECARGEGKYWAYHDKLFEKQAQLSSDPAFFVGLAGELGLDAKAFSACVTTHKYKDEVAKDYQDGAAAGVQGTPATFVNGKLISGAVPYETFKAAIDEALAKAK